MPSTVATPVSAIVRSSSAQTCSSTARTPAAPRERQAVDVGPADQDGVRAQRQRDERVGAAAHAAVEEHRHPAGDLADHARQRVQRRDRAVDLPPAVVGDDDPVDAVLEGERRVARVLEALEQDRQPRARPAGGRGRPRSARSGRTRRGRSPRRPAAPGSAGCRAGCRGSAGPSRPARARRPGSGAATAPPRGRSHRRRGRRAPRPAPGTAGRWCTARCPRRGRTAGRRGRGRRCASRARACRG